MTAMAQPRRGLVLRGVLALAAFLLLLALGTWQIERMAWKEAVLATLAERLSAAPVPLPPQAQWARLDAREFEFRRVAFTAAFLPDKDGLVYTTGSPLRGASGPGHLVFTPARAPDGGLVMVDRGFVPEGKPAAGAPGTVDIVGVMRWPEARSTFTPADDPARNLWFVRDPAAIAAAKGLAVAPFYIEQEAPAVPGGPLVGRLRPSLPNNHLQYALTWYALALVLAGVFLVWAIGRRREQP